MDGKLRNMTAIYISQNQKMLLLYRIGSKVVAPSWCGIGGHFEKEELNDAKACVLRELSEEMRILENDLDNLQLRYVALRMKNGEIRQNYYFFANLKPSASVTLTCSEGQPEWIDYGDILHRRMPHSAKAVLEHYFKIGRSTQCVYGGIATPDGVCFTELNEF